MCHNRLTDSLSVGHDIVAVQLHCAALMLRPLKRAPEKKRTKIKINLPCFLRNHIN